MIRLTCTIWMVEADTILPAILLVSSALLMRIQPGPGRIDISLCSPRSNLLLSLTKSTGLLTVILQESLIQVLLHIHDDCATLPNRNHHQSRRPRALDISPICLFPKHQQCDSRHHIPARLPFSTSTPPPHHLNEPPHHLSDNRPDSQYLHSNHRPSKPAENHGRRQVAVLAC